MQDAQLIWDDTSDPQNPGLVVRANNELWTLHPAWDGSIRPEDMDEADREECITDTLAWHGLADGTEIQVSQINSSTIREWATELGATTARLVASSTANGGATLYAIPRPDGGELLALATNGEPVGEEDEGFAETLEFYGLTEATTRIEAAR